MNSRVSRLNAVEDRGPLRVMFLLTSMPVGGAETLLRNLVRSMERTQFEPEICCLKGLGPIGEELAREFETHSHLLSHKLDLRVLPRLASLLKRRKIDAVITVGCGDKMFWGRIAAKLAHVPVVASALHSTGWPDGVGRLNRLLTPWT
ncbi:MAG: glycosyltransferase, partial [Planctomycetales bacterium]|nr:glycosyltransferase [Planctomycetales bacterium]